MNPSLVQNISNTPGRNHGFESHREPGGHNENPVDQRANIRNQRPDGVDNSRDMQRRRYYLQKQLQIENEARVILNRMLTSDRKVRTNCEEAQAYALGDQVDIIEITGLVSKIRKQLEFLVKTKDSLEKYSERVRQLNIQEEIFNIEQVIPDYEYVCSTLEARIKKMEIEEKNGIKPIKVTASTFPVYEGKIEDFEDWISSWTKLAEVSKLDKNNLVIKLRESLEGHCKETLGSKLLSTGSYDDIMEKLKSVYDKPIIKVKTAVKSFFGTLRLGTGIESDRNFITALTDVLNYTDKVGLSKENLLCNYAVDNLSETSRELVRREISRIQPDFKITQEILVRAFEEVAGSLDNNITKTNLSAYNGQIGNQGKQYKPGPKGKKPIHSYSCLIHCSDDHTTDNCNIKSGKEVRAHLISTNRCQACLRQKKWHYIKCSVTNCPHHPQQKHHPLTCAGEGPSFVHPGCQFMASGNMQQTQVSSTNGGANPNTNK